MLHSVEDIVTMDGVTLEPRKLRFERTIDPGTAYLATSLLQGVVERGTAARVRWMGLKGAIAGKTGTTDDERDLWFAGYTPELVAVVWVGYDEPRSIGIPSTRGALPIWVRFVKAALGDEVRGDFLPPPEVHRLDIDPSSGALALASCPERRAEFFLPGTEPEHTCPADGDGPGSGSGRRRGFFGWLRDQL